MGKAKEDDWGSVEAGSAHVTWLPFLLSEAHSGLVLPPSRNPWGKVWQVEIGRASRAPLTVDMSNWVNLKEGILNN